MKSKAYRCNGYHVGVGYNKHLNPSKRAGLKSVINTLKEKYDKQRVPLWMNKKTAVERKFSPKTRHAIDTYYSGSEWITWENPLELELHDNKTQKSPSYRNCNKYRLSHMQNVAINQTLATSEWGSREHFAISPMGDEEFLASSIPPQLVLDDTLGVNEPKSMSMWDCPGSPHFQVPQSPIDDTFSDLLSVFSNPITMRTIVDQSIEEPKIRDSNQLPELKYDECKDGSFLYVTTDDAEKLILTLLERGLHVQNIGKTRTPGVLAVLFNTHEIAKRAFTTQQDIGIRMVPHKPTKRNWYKNPTPKFHVMFETTRRLTVKKGKSISKVKVGDFLMLDARINKGCILWADQLKGHRLRVVGFVGKFMSTDGRIIENNKAPSMTERKVIGWISTQCNKTKKKFVLRKSKNHIEDYLHDNGKRALE